jgi:hypothetical protein
MINISSTCGRQDDHVVSMRDRERARDGSVNVLSQRTLRVFSDHKQETDSSTKGLVCLSAIRSKTGYEPSLSPALHPLFSFRCTRDCTACAPSALVRFFFLSLTSPVQSKGGQHRKSIFETALGFVPSVLFLQRLVHVLLPCFSERVLQWISGFNEVY